MQILIGISLFFQILQPTNQPSLLDEVKQNFFLRLALQTVSFMKVIFGILW